MISLREQLERELITILKRHNVKSIRASIELEGESYDILVDDKVRRRLEN